MSAPVVAQAKPPLAADDPRHGTSNGYNNLGCRCEACCAANTAYCVAWRHETGYSVPAEDFRYLRRRSAELRDTHGTEGRYVNLGCRCDACRAAMAAARRKRRLTPNVKVHNYSGYSSGCRCETCREARRIYDATRRASATTTSPRMSSPKNEPGAA